MLISPDLMRKLDQLELVTRRQFVGRIRGERRSKRKGHSLEFADYRSYVQGDDIRHIDWKILARLDRLFLKLYMEEEDLFVHFLLDTSHSMGMGEPSKLLYAKRLTAALSYVALAGAHRVMIQPFSQKLHPPLPYTRGRGQWPRLERYLRDLSAEGETGMAQALTMFRISSVGSGVVFLISDLFDKDGSEHGLKRLIGRNFEVVVLHLLSPEEEDPPWDGDWNLVDIEDGSTRPVSMTTFVKERYREVVAQFRAEQQELCFRYGYQYVPIRSDVPLESVILFSLRRRGVLQ